ncbi:hypothetical protein FDUTEX481_03469 [Tolypothrix sp. PCC 7601]|nr:hypothetical protein FDUTEX481_03469 [Tolypothrix sp. PCC 7601]
MRKGKIVGDCDKLVTWRKSKICPIGLSKDEFDTLPPVYVVNTRVYNTDKCWGKCKQPRLWLKGW